MNQGNLRNLFGDTFKVIDAVCNGIHETNGITRARTDIYETNGNYYMNMEMPGVKKENIDISLSNGVLKVEGKIETQNLENVTVLRKGRPTTSYIMEYDVNPSLQEEHISASYELGILRLTFPSKIEIPKENKTKIKIN